MTDQPDSFHRSLDAALERTDPTSPEAYSWPAIDVSQHVEAVTSAASLFAQNQIVVRRLPEYDDSYLTTAYQQAFAEHYDEINLEAAEEEADEYMKTIGWTDPNDVVVDEPESSEVYVWGSTDPVIQSFTVSFATSGAWNDALEILFGRPVVPLCRREIPAEGQE